MVWADGWPSLLCHKSNDALSCSWCYEALGRERCSGCCAEIEGDGWVLRMWGSEVQVIEHIETPFKLAL